MIHPRHEVLDPVYLLDVRLRHFQRHNCRKNFRYRVHERRLQHIYRLFLFPHPCHTKSQLQDTNVPRFHGIPPPSQGNRTVHVFLLIARTFGLTEGQGCLPCAQTRYRQHGPRLLESGRIRIPGSATLQNPGRCIEFCEQPLFRSWHGWAVG